MCRVKGSVAAAIHVVDHAQPAISGTGRIDHFGFEASGYAGVKAKLDAHGANVMEQTLTAIGLYRIFAQSPEGVWIELNFDLDDYRAGAAI